MRFPPHLRVANGVEQVFPLLICKMVQSTGEISFLWAQLLGIPIFVFLTDFCFSH